MARSEKEDKSARVRVREAALAFLVEAPGGLHYSELKAKVRRRLPGMNPNTLHGSLFAFMKDLPPEITKPSRGLYCHVDQVETGPTVPGKVKRIIRESDFYEPFAEWLKTEVEECTRAIPLGGAVFKDKWGTPDVIGVLESRKSDIVQFPTEIVSAEVKIDGNQLITAFGQACAYRLFSHKSYLVVPTQSPEGDVARLDVLSRLFGIGLILFDASSPEEPRFAIRVRASKHEPDGFYANRYLREVEKQLFG
jgi:hypothetical protein